MYTSCNQGIQHSVSRLCGGFGNKQIAQRRFVVQQRSVSIRQRSIVVAATEAEAEADQIESQIDELTQEELEVAISGRDKPLIIDFYAPWCGPCLVLADELKKVAKRVGKDVRIVKVDADKETKLATELQIYGLPTLIFVGMDSSKPALRYEGLLTAEDIVKVVQNELQ
eukprot:TRINITY_DN31796_c0_g2_i1.p1 TRINITY_DN31796_c0_g2~~TRINITY_DN31796_c0_g2_i1.p1  ORF type:complete len:169 (-),score=16.45 TRINITY_DN31796_c0_g2_i1:335-841(-)